MSEPRGALIWHLSGAAKQGTDKKSETDRIKAIEELGWELRACGHLLLLVASKEYAGVVLHVYICKPGEHDKQKSRERVNFSRHHYVIEINTTQPISVLKSVVLMYMYYLT